MLQAKLCAISPHIARRRLLGYGGAVASVLAFSSLACAGETRKFYTNLEEAREAGEAIREAKERALGPIVTLPSGIRYRELEPGSGRDVAPGDVISIHYVIYRLNGMYLDSLGYGNEGKDDVGETLTFQLGANAVPRAVELGIQGMRVGGKRRIVVPPELGWTSGSLLPQPTTSAAQRRLMNSVKRPLLFEVELVKASS